MNAVHRKHVYSSKSVPHFAVYPQDATHRYLNEAKTEWKYMTARTDQEFLAWGAGWMEDRQPQVKHGETWKDLLP